jgi:cytochrome c peroxidase
MSLANVGYASTLTWGNPLLVELERQVLLPLFGETPIELGFSQKEDLTDRLATDPLYENLFRAAFIDEDELFTLAQVTQSLAAFQRTLISGRSPYDRWAYDDKEEALNEQELRGYELFFSEKFECFHCHGGFNFTDHTHYASKSFFEAPYHTTGLYNLGGTGAYPDPNQGVAEISLEDRHQGQHKAPTLRNIAVTAPYMHDGSIKNLEGVLDHYAAGGRTIAEGCGNSISTPRFNSGAVTMKMISSTSITSI